MQHLMQTPSPGIFSQDQGGTENQSAEATSSIQTRQLARLRVGANRHGADWEGAKPSGGCRSSPKKAQAGIAVALQISRSPVPASSCSRRVKTSGSSMHTGTTRTLPSASLKNAAAAVPGTRLTVAEYRSASAEALQTQVQHVQNALSACQAAYDRANADVTKSLSKIQQLQEQIKSLQVEDSQLSAKVPLPVNRLCRVRQWLADKVANFDAEQAALEGKQMALLKAESQLRSQQTEASLLDEAASTLNSAAAAATSAALHHAAAAHDHETAAARRQLMLMAAVQQQAQQQELLEEQQEQDKARVAEQCQGAARQRLAVSQAAIREQAAAVAEAAAADQSKNWEVLMQLKSKVDEVRDAVARKAEKTRQLRKQKAEHEQREFEALQEQGLNPYEIYRIRDAKTAAAKAAAELLVVQQQRKAQVAAALDAEDKNYRKQLAGQEFDRQVEKEYQQQMGIAAQQHRTDVYMRSHTLTKQALLDPTSRMPVYPSETVLIKPASFGLGRTSPKAVDMVAKKHGKDIDLQDCLLLPSKYRSAGSSPSTQRSYKAVEADIGGSGKGGENDADAGAPLTDVEAGDAGGSGSGSSASGSDADSEEARDVDEPASSNAAMDTGRDHGSKDGKHHHHHHHHHKHKHLEVAKLSKFEADRLQAAKQRHKAQITQPKRAFGRDFAGDAFIAEPPAIMFKDFVPGKTHSCTVSLINRSFTGNSIRLLEVPTEVMHVLELDMPPSGSLAPGASATLRVTFKPQADAALSATIPLLSETGPLSLPFKALVRQALPSIDPGPDVSLDGRAGGVMLGASSSRPVVISNAGVLKMLYDIKVVGPLSCTTDYDEPQGPPPPADASEVDLAALQAQAWASSSLTVAGLRVCGIKGVVQGYSSSSFKVEFAPKVVGPVEVPVQVSFFCPDHKGLVVPPVQLTLQATGKELPVSTMTPLVDFKCVMFGQQYAAPLLLANAGKSAMKVLVVARPELLEWFSFTPDFGFIQAGDTLSVSICLKPTSDMTRKLCKYLVPQQHEVLELPLQVTVPGQPLPLAVKLKVQPTTSDLYFNPKTLDFGKVPLTEAAGVYLTITNPSLLPQSFTFGAKLPLGFKISPNAGYGRVLPNESVKLLATFQPPIPGLQFFDLNCRALTGRVFRLEGKCDGLQSEVTLSHNIVKLPATAFQDSSRASVVLKNTSLSTAHLFEFGVPQGSFLQVTPRVGVLKPQSSMRVQLDFSPPAAPDTASGPPAGLKDVSPAEASGTAATANKAVVTPRTSTNTQPHAGPTQQQQHDHQRASSAAGPHGSAAWYKEWLLPCFIRPAEPFDHADNSRSVRFTDIASMHEPCASQPGPHQQTSTLGLAHINSNHSNNRPGSTGGGGPACVLHLSVVTCAVPAELLLVSPQLFQPPGKNYWVLDFGALPVGERTTKQLVLENAGPDVASLVAAPMDPAVGAFAIVTALRPIPPHGGKARILLAFSPSSCCEYQEMLTLRSCKSRLRACLKGRGIAPTLAVNPSSAASTSGGLAFGDVLLSDPVCKELKVAVTNTCPFTVNFTTKFIGPGLAQGPGPAGTTLGAAAVRAAATAGAAPSAGAGPVPRASTTGAAAAAITGVSTSGSTSGQQQHNTVAPADAATAVDPRAPTGCFYCKPCSGVLEAGQSQELTIVFAPLGTMGIVGPGSCGPLSPYVSDRLQILVPHQQQDVVIPLHGNAWPDGVFISGLEYHNSSSLPAKGQQQQPTAAPSQRAVDRAKTKQDPFAAILAAASMAAAAASASATAASTPQSGKGKQPAVAAPAAPSSQQQQQAAGNIPVKDMASILAAAGFCDLTQGFVRLPGPVSAGQTASATVDFGAIKSSAAGAAGELVVDELPQEAKDAGWAIDPVKVSVPAGERRPLSIRYTAPAASALQGTAIGALSRLQLPAEQVLTLCCTMKGGCQPMAGGWPAAAAADGSRRLTLVCSCVLASG